MTTTTTTLTAEHLAAIERLEQPASDDRLALLIHAERHQHGAHQPLSRVYLGSYTSYYWGHAQREGFTFEEYEAAQPVLAAYKEALHVRDEIAPGWEDDGPARYFADNSIEQPQRATDGSGRTRRIMVKPPSGDIC